MEINNAVDFILYTAFFIGTIFVLIPLGVNFVYVGFVGVIRYKKVFYTEDSEIYRIGKNAFEIIGVGCFAIGFSIWFLFYDEGGHIFNYPSEVMRFFS